MAAALQRRSNSEILITKDFLGGLSSNPESDLNSSKTEHASHERCGSPNSSLISSSSNHQKQRNPDEDFQALNLNYPPSSSSSSSSPPPPPPATRISMFEDTCLDLKLQSSSHYQSVCTLDKVKSALQRAEKETAKKRPSPSPSPSPSSSAMFAAACPGCLLYVIILRTDPKCPRCNSTVPSPLLVKKAKIDLNASV